MVRALAADGYLPALFTRSSRFQTPGSAIALATGLAAVLAFFLGYGSLVDVSNVALFCQYIPTCVAVIVLRYRMPSAQRTYRLPAGPIIPMAGAVASAVLLVMAKPRVQEWLFAAKALALGLIIWAATAAIRRFSLRRSSSTPAKVS